MIVVRNRRKHPVQLSVHSLRLFHSHTFGQIAGLVDITAAAVGNLIGEQLGRNSIEQGVKFFIDLWQIEYIIGQRGKMRVSFRTDEQQPALARLDLFHVGDCFLIHAVLRTSAITGMSLSIRAIGPCLSSPAA